MQIIESLKELKTWLRRLVGKILGRKFDACMHPTNHATTMPTSKKGGVCGGYLQPNVGSNPTYDAKVAHA